MASTKEMQARAKARKQGQQAKTKYRLNESNLNKVLRSLSEELINLNPNQDYTQTNNSLYAAKSLANKVNGTHMDFQQILEYRVKFEEALKKKYNVELPTDTISAFMVDAELVLKDAKVPQRTRVMSGLLDTFISVLAMQLGVFKVVNV
jgi:hypothetical protein